LVCVPIIFLIDMDRTLLFSSHIMSDVEKIANRVGIMKQGKLFLDQELDDLKASVRQVQIDYTDTPPRTIDVPNLISRKSMANSVVLTIKDFDEHTLENLKSITQVSDIKLLNLNFEEIFIELAK
jgi:ABC-2 type transport system ATP-binding protein